MPEIKQYVTYAVEYKSRRSGRWVDAYRVHGEHPELAKRALGQFRQGIRPSSKPEGFDSALVHVLTEARPDLYTYRLMRRESCVETSSTEITL